MSQIDEKIESMLEKELGEETRLLAFSPVVKSFHLPGPLRLLPLITTGGFSLISLFTRIAALGFLAGIFLVFWIALFLILWTKKYILAVTETHLALLLISRNFQKLLGIEKIVFNDILTVDEIRKRKAWGIKIEPREGDALDLSFRMSSKWKEGASKILEVLRSKKNIVISTE